MKITGQIISWIFVLALGAILNYEQLPGNKVLCEAGQKEYVLAWLIFILSVLFLLINSWNHYQKNNWKNYRRIAMATCWSILIITFSLRWLIFTIAFGTIKSQFKHPKDSMFFNGLTLYENGKFHIQSFDGSCQAENVGTYRLTKELLQLEYKGEKRKYYGTQYSIEDKILKCLDCEMKDELILVE